MKEIADVLSSRSQGVRPSEFIDSYLKQIEAENSKVNALVWVNPEAKAQADQAVDGPLSGVPMAIKDLLCHEGTPTTAASNYLKEFVPTYSSTVTRRLVDAGAVIVGKANLDEFAMGSSNENSCFGTVKNPWDHERVAGGSSGGSAAAVASEMCVASIGSDTGGSIRQPASFCGLVGIKPTYGRVSRFGMVAFASSLDQAGPMTHSVVDSAKILEVISGFDRHDSTTSQREVPKWSQSLDADIKGKKVGLIKEFTAESMSPVVQKAFEQTVADLKELGAEVVEVSVPSIKHSVPVYYLIATSEASSNLSRYDGIRYGRRGRVEAEAKGDRAGDNKPGDLDQLYRLSRGQGFGQEVKRRILLGTYALSSGYYDAYYLKACQVRRMIQDELKAALKQCNVLLSPVATTPAFKIGERIDDPVQMYMNDIFTTSANLAGLPALSLPVGLAKAKEGSIEKKSTPKSSTLENGLPLGMQFMADHFNEQSLFDCAKALEQKHAWKERFYDGL